MICKSLADYLIYSAHFSKYSDTKFILFMGLHPFKIYFKYGGGG